MNKKHHVGCVDRLRVGSSVRFDSANAQQRDRDHRYGGLSKKSARPLRHATH